MKACVKCGCRIYIYAEKSITYYEGTFGQYLSNGEDQEIVEIGRSPNSVKCKKCGKRYPIELARVLKKGD